MSDENISTDELKAGIDEAAKIVAYETTPATMKDVHRIARNSVLSFMNEVLKPQLDEYTKVATIALIVQEVLVRKGLATEADFKESIAALEEAGVIKRVGASKSLLEEPPPAPDSSPENH